MAQIPTNNENLPFFSAVTLKIFAKNLVKQPIYTGFSQINLLFVALIIWLV